MTNIFIYKMLREKIACSLFYICIIKIPYNAKSKMKTMNEMKHKIKSKNNKNFVVYFSFCALLTSTF